MWERTKKNFWKIEQVKDHRLAIQTCYLFYLGTIPLRASLHDLDKLIMLKIGLSQTLVKKLHRRFAQHHNTETKNRNVLIEMIMDWECARFTKPDKPLNARDTLYKYYPEMEDRILPILNKLKI